MALTKSSVAAGISAGTVRYVELSTTNGVRDDISGSAAPTGGTQEITETAASGLNYFDLRLVKGIVYFRGNKPALIDQLGLTAAKATSYVNRWVSVRKGEKPYKTFADGITTKSNLSQLTSLFVADSSGSAPANSQAASSEATSSSSADPSPASSQAASYQLTSAPPDTVITGKLFDGKGHPPIGTARLTVSTASLLPQSFAALAVGGNGARLTLSWRFSDWHKAVRVKAPSGAVSYSSLKTGSSSTTK